MLIRSTDIILASALHEALLLPEGIEPFYCILNCAPVSLPYSSNLLFLIAHSFQTPNLL